MISYNPKEWFSFIFRFHKGDTFRKLIPLMMGIGLYSAGIAWLEIEYWKLSDSSHVKNITVMHTMLGFVISLLLVFRTNTAYDRWWEGRKQWGALVNNSRNLAIKLAVMLKDPADKEIMRKLIPGFASVLNLHLKNADISHELFDDATLASDHYKHKPNQIVMGVIVLIGVGKYVYDVNIDHNFEPVVEGKVYRSGTIPPDELPDYIKKYNIKSVVDLRRPGTKDLVNNPEVNPELEAEKKAVESVPGTNYFDVGSEQIPDQAVLDKYFAVMDNPDNYPVLVHCYHGEGRAPLFGAIYKIEYEGTPNEQARKEARWFADLCVFNAEKSKGKYLLEYKTRKQKEGEK